MPAPVERNVLEWRFDPASSSRLPVAIDYDLQVIVFCSEGLYLKPRSRSSAGPRTLASNRLGGWLSWVARKQSANRAANQALRGPGVMQRIGTAVSLRPYVAVRAIGSN